MMTPDEDALDAVEFAEFNRVLDAMDMVSDVCEVLELLGFDARWEWCSADEFPLLTVGRRTW